MQTAIPSKGRRVRAPKFALALPSMVWYLLFFVIPIAYIVVYSFGLKDSSQRIPVDLSDPTLQNYRDVLDSTGVFFTTFRATIEIALIATALCVLIGFPVAYFIACKVKEKWRAVLLALIVIPSFTSFLIRTLAWRIPLAPNGALSRLFLDWGLTSGKFDVLETRGAVQLAIVYNYLGFMILPLFVALDRVDVSLRQASKDLGAGRVATITGVTIPLAAPGIAAGVLLTYIPMCGDYVTAAVLGGAKGNMIGAMIVSQFSGAQNWPIGSAMAVLMIVAVLMTMLIGAVIVWVVPKLFRLLTPFFAPLRKAVHERGLRTAQSARRGFTFDVIRGSLAALVVLVLLFLFTPIAMVIAHSFNRGSSFSIWSGGWSTRWWGTLFDAKQSVNTIVTFLAICVIGVAAGFVLKRVQPTRHALQRWAFPMSFTIAVVICGFRTHWYRDVFLDVNIGDSLRNSFIAALGASAIAVLLGGSSGVALARRPGRWASVFLVIIFLVLVTPEIMDAIALAGWMETLGGPFKHNVGPLSYGLLRLWVGQSLYASAVVTLIVRARLAGQDEALEEAAADLGAPPLRAFRQITLPLIAPALVAGGLLSFTLCLDNTVISTLVSAGGVSTFPVALLGAARSTIKPFWGAGSVVLFFVTITSLGFVARVLRRSGESASNITATLTGS